ncbi:MAG: undecaprenyl diphosphate synthase family protein [Thaumarchaeota archaeon]|nr:undecaprenyl diphosphate synthase family protein [Nitrososphaerota archaeon]
MVNILLIPDGSRRAARKKGMAYASAYRLAAAKVDMAVKFLLSQEEEVKSVVVYGLSYDNLVRREASELASILEAQEERYKIWLSDPFFSSSRVRVTFHGDLKVMFEKLPPSYLEAMQELEEKTSQYDWKNLFILIGYSGSRENETLSVKDVKPELPSIDLVIRTGGRARLSDALPYQTAYAELYVIDNFISDLEATDLSKALDAFGMVVRNLGS